MGYYRLVFNFSRSDVYLIVRALRLYTEGNPEGQQDDNEQGTRLMWRIEKRLDAWKEATK